MLSKKGVGTSVSFTVSFPKGTPENLPLKETGIINTNLLASKRILMADDNEMNRLVASTILRNYGAIIDEAQNGVEAIEKVRQQVYDLVLMDVQMPVMDGIEATQIIRASVNEHLPVIALTAFAVKGDSQKFMAAGMSDYLSKPFGENQLLSVVSRWLGKPVVASQSDEAEKEVEVPLFDLSKLQRIVQDNGEFVAKMVDLFIDLGPASVKEMKEAYAVGDFEKMQKTAHRMKPSIDNMGIALLHNDIRDIEKNAAIYQTSDRLEILMNKVDSIISRITNDLKIWRKAT